MGSIRDLIRTKTGRSSQSGPPWLDEARDIVVEQVFDQARRRELTNARDIDNFVSTYVENRYMSSVDGVPTAEVMNQSKADLGSAVGTKLIADARVLKDYGLAHQGSTSGSEALLTSSAVLAAAEQYPWQHNAPLPEQTPVPASSDVGGSRDFPQEVGVHWVKHELMADFLVGESDGKRADEVDDMAQDFVDKAYAKAKAGGYKMNQSSGDSLASLKEAIGVMVNEESRVYYDMAVQNGDTDLGRSSLRIHNGFHATAQALDPTAGAQGMKKQGHTHQGDSDLRKSSSPLDVLGQRSSKPSGLSGPDF